MDRITCDWIWCDVDNNLIWRTRLKWNQLLLYIWIHKTNTSSKKSRISSVFNFPLNCLSFVTWLSLLNAVKGPGPAFCKGQPFFLPLFSITTCWLACMRRIKPDIGKTVPPLRAKLLRQKVKISQSEWPVYSISNSLDSDTCCVIFFAPLILWMKSLYVPLSKPDEKLRGQKKILQGEGSTCIKRENVVLVTRWIVQNILYI